MRPPDLETSFRAAAAAQPSVPPALDRVRRRARRRRVVPVAVGVVVLVVAAAVGGVAASRSSARDEIGVAAGPSDTVEPADCRRPARHPPGRRRGASRSSTRPATTVRPPGSSATRRRRRCSCCAPAVRCGSWPTARPAGGRRPWPRVAPATWRPTSSPTDPVLASRVDGSAVVLDRIVAPDRAEEAARLPFEVNADAPDGVCDIDGYLASFVVTPTGVVLGRHASGPIPHSCPYFEEDATATTDPWRCQSKEAMSPEIRDVDRLDRRGRATGRTTGSAPSPFVARSTRSPNYAIALPSEPGRSTSVDVVGRLTSVDVVTPTLSEACCGGGQVGTAFALSPDGTQLAWASTPDEVSVEPLESADRSGPRTLWSTPGTSRPWRGPTSASPSRSMAGRPCCHPSTAAPSSWTSDRPSRCAASPGGRDRPT